MPAPRPALLLLCALALTAGAAGVPGAGAPGAPGPGVDTPGPSSSAGRTAAPSEPAAVQSATRPLTGRVVVLDPGHNGGNSSAPGQTTRQVPDGRGAAKPCNTTGTSTDAGYPEHAFTWDLAQRVRAALEAQEVRVVLTRMSDDGVGPCVDERGTAGQRAGADAVVSLHADGAAASGSGFHVAYSAPPLNPAQAGPALTLAKDLRDALAGEGFGPSNYTGRDGLSPRADLAGLNLATVPAALVECANMRNPAEAALVSSPSGRARYAAAIAAGIGTFLARPR